MSQFDNSGERTPLAEDLGAVVRSSRGVNPDTQVISTPPAQAPGAVEVAEASSARQRGRRSRRRGGGNNRAFANPTSIK